MQLNISQLKGEVDAMKVQLLSSDTVIHEARNLQERWETLSKKDKRSIVEVILDSIVVYADEVEINLKDLPTTNTNVMDSTVSTSSNPTSSELVIKDSQNLCPVATPLWLKIHFFNI